MKVCHTEAMKMIKELENNKSLLIQNELDNSQISYKEDEEKLAVDYDYNTTRNEIKKLDEQIRHLKTLLAIANTKVKIDEFNMSIGEGLVYLAQLNNERIELEQLARNPQKRRRITPNGVIEYTECVYDVKKVNEDIIKVRTTINNLQIAIDRANLTNYIEF